MGGLRRRKRWSYIEGLIGMGHSNTPNTLQRGIHIPQAPYLEARMEEECKDNRASQIVRSTCT